MNNREDNSLNLLTQIGSALHRFGKNLAKTLRKFKKRSLTKFTKWIDPKLAPYRKAAAPTKTPSAGAKAPANVPESSPKTTPATSEPALRAPQTVEEFFEILKQTPRSVLSQRERHVIAAIMKFPEVRVSDLMLPESAITYVRATEILGPLTLDRLYRSGFQHFPVIDHNHKIIGLVHTTALNSLEIKQTSRAHEILDPKVYYLRDDYTLNQALAAFLRTNCYFFLVIDKYERIIGMLTYQMLVDYLVGETPSDNFTRDSDRLAVAKRR